MAWVEYNRNTSSYVCPLLVLLRSHSLSLTAARLAGTLDKIRTSSSSYFEQPPEQKHKVDKAHAGPQLQRDTVISMPGPGSKQAT